MPCHMVVNPVTTLWHADADKRAHDRKLPCKRLQPSHRPSAKSLTLVPAGTTGYIAANQTAVPFPTEIGSECDLQWKIASSLFWAWRQNAPPSLTAGVLEELNQGSPSGELNCRRKKALTSLDEGEWRSKRDTGQHFPPITCYPTHGKKLVQHGDCRILRRCSVSPSLQLRQRGTMHQRIGGGNTPSGESPHSQGVRLALRLVRQCDGIHYPVGQPLLGDSLPFLLTSMADKELLRASEAPGVVHVYAQCSYWT